jgi:hypothetical protein
LRSQRLFLSINDKQTALAPLTLVMCAECVQIIDKGAGLRAADACRAGLPGLVWWGV